MSDKINVRVLRRMKEAGRKIVGVVAWAATGSLQTGLPLFVAGLLAVIVATMARRQLR